MAGGIDEIKAWINKAELTLEAARMLAKSGFRSDAISRAYYAMFYAAKAAVESEGIDAKKHSTVISAFGRLFSRTGRLDPRLHKALIAAFRQREAADYIVGLTISEEAVKARLTESEEFVLAIKTLLGI